jgi:hypothetical protein
VFGQLLCASEAQRARGQTKPVDRILAFNSHRSLFSLSRRLSAAHAGCDKTPALFSLSLLARFIKEREAKGARGAERTEGPPANSLRAPVK